MLNVVMSLNNGDFMKRRKEAKFQREKLHFWIKHHIYTNVKQCLNQQSVINHERVLLNNFSICAKMV